MNRDVVRKLGSDESMSATYRRMFTGITDTDVVKLISSFRSGNMKDYTQKLTEAKQKYLYTDLQLTFEDGQPEWS